MLALFMILSLFGGLLLHAPAAADTAPAFACDVAATPALAAYPFCNASLGAAARVADLVARMTLPEKVKFLGDQGPAVERLGVPAYGWWSEALHGVSFVGRPGAQFTALVPGATSFPQVILTAASFNASLFEAIGAIVSTEARAMYNVGMARLTYWSPTVNVFRDPRWGRGQETPGEDPLLASKYAAGYVRGLQSGADGDPEKLKVAACCKHYTAYDLDNWKSANRLTFNAVVTKQDMDDTFQPPFKSCVVDGNVACVMCSYNQVNGAPTCADKNLLSGTVRGDWKLNGYIASDCDSVAVLFWNQRYTRTLEDAAAVTIKAGLDLNCGTFLSDNAVAAVQAGKLSEDDVNNAITNNLMVLMRLGFFDGDPRRSPYGGLGPGDVCTPANQELAREAARQGIVLLKNDGGTLPLSTGAVKSLAVIGPNANASYAMIGSYVGKPCKYTTPLQGLAANVANAVYQPVCWNVSCGDLHLDSAKQAAASADATVIVVGEDQSVEQEGQDRVSLLLPGQQQKLVSEVANVSKGPVILVVMSGGPFDVSFAKASSKVPAILWVGYPGEAGGAALADIVFGLSNPSGRLPMTWYPENYVQSVAMTDMRMRADPTTGYPGRSYRFYGGDVVFPFGHGLSYSAFKHHLNQAPDHVIVPLPETHACYSDDCRSVDAAGEHCEGLVFEVLLRVKNAGAVEGRHSVLLFSSPPPAAVRGAPRKQLVAFEKVHLRRGEAAEVAFTVDVCKHLSLVDENGDRKVALGEHILDIGDVKHSLRVRN